MKGLLPSGTAAPSFTEPGQLTQSLAPNADSTADITLGGQTFGAPGARGPRPAADSFATGVDTERKPVARRQRLTPDHGGRLGSPRDGWLALRFWIRRSSGRWTRRDVDRAARPAFDLGHGGRRGRVGGGRLDRVVPDAADVRRVRLAGVGQTGSALEPEHRRGAFVEAPDVSVLASLRACRCRRPDVAVDGDLHSGRARRCRVRRAARLPPDRSAGRGAVGPVGGGGRSRGRDSRLVGLLGVGADRELRPDGGDALSGCG